MGTSQSPLIVIPARIGSKRLESKPLRLINGVPLVVHVWRRAIEADIGPVWVSSDSSDVVETVIDAGGDAFCCMPESEHCGSDRVAWTTEFINEVTDPPHDYIINLQGDLPFIDPEIIRVLASAREDMKADIVTAICRRVPVITSQSIDYFARMTLWEHIGLYAYTAESLRLFASLPPSERELEYGLEQLRALEHGMTMDYIGVDHMPLEINTESDLDHANLIARFCRAEDTGPRDRGSGGCATVDDWVNRPKTFVPSSHDNTGSY